MIVKHLGPVAYDLTLEAMRAFTAARDLGHCVDEAIDVCPHHLDRETRRVFYERLLGGNVLHERRIHRGQLGAAREVSNRRGAPQIACVSLARWYAS